MTDSDFEIKFGDCIDSPNEDSICEEFNRPTEVELTEEILREHLPPNLKKSLTLEKVEYLDIIFTKINYLSPIISSLSQLKELCLIRTGLKNMDAFRHLSPSIRFLNVSENELTSTTGLETLVNLKELFLHDNYITKIEALEPLQKLEKLWLFSNRIETITNLNDLHELKELWIQDNKITSIGDGLEELINLETIALDQNPIQDLKEIKPLLHLPSLNKVSFGGPDFSPCPMATLEGYRNFVLFHLKQIKVLDGIPLIERDHHRVQDQYLQSVREFNDTIDILKNEYRDNMKAIELHRRTNNHKESMLKKLLMDSFLQLEKIVKEGREKIQSEHIYQRKIREEKRKNLEKSLNSIKKKYLKEINSLLQKENTKIDLEKNYFDAAKQRINDEVEEQTLMINTQYETNNAVICHPLDSRRPEYRFVKARFLDAAFKNPREKSAPAPQYRLQRIVKIYNDGGETAFRKYNKGSSSMLRLFFPIQLTQLKDVLIHGFTKPDITPYPLHFYNAIPPSPNPDSELTSHTIILCKVVCEKLYEHSSDTPLDLTAIPRGYLSVRVDDHFYLLHPSNGVVALPEYFIRYDNPYSPDDSENEKDLPLVEHLEKLLYNVTCEDRDFDVLDALEKRAEDEFQYYQQILWDRCDPNIAHQIKENEQDIEKLEMTLQTLNQQIYQEKQLHETIARDFHDQIYSRQAPSTK